MTIVSSAAFAVSLTLSGLAFAASANFSLTTATTAGFAAAAAAAFCAARFARSSLLCAAGCPRENFGYVFFT